MGVLSAVCTFVRPHIRRLLVSETCKIYLGPPTQKYQPTIYLSGDDYEAVKAVESFLGQTESILKMRVLDKQGDGAASALKLSYAGLTKGFTALGITMILCECLADRMMMHRCVRTGGRV